MYSRSAPSTSDYAVERCRLSLDRFIHDDALIWTKLRMLFIVSAGLGASYKYAHDSKEHLLALAVAAAGMASCSLLAISLNNSYRCLRCLGGRFERSLKELMDMPPKVDMPPLPRPVPRTSLLATYLAVLATAGWGVVVYRASGLLGVNDF